MKVGEFLAKAILTANLPAARHFSLFPKPGISTETEGCMESKAISYSPVLICQTQRAVTS